MVVKRLKGLFSRKEEVSKRPSQRFIDYVTQKAHRYGVILTNEDVEDLWKKYTESVREQERGYKLGLLGTLASIGLVAVNPLLAVPVASIFAFGGLGHTLRHAEDFRTYLHNKIQEKLEGEKRVAHSLTEALEGEVEHTEVLRTLKRADVADRKEAQEHAKGYNNFRKYVGRLGQASTTLGGVLLGLSMPLGVVNPALAYLSAAAGFGTIASNMAAYSAVKKRVREFLGRIRRKRKPRDIEILKSKLEKELSERKNDPRFWIYFEKHVDDILRKRRPSAKDYHRAKVYYELLSKAKEELGGDGSLRPHLLRIENKLLSFFPELKQGN